MTRQDGGTGFSLWRRGCNPRVPLRDNRQLRHAGTRGLYPRSGSCTCRNAGEEMYRRNLPHWHPPGAALFVTWRLAGTLPALQSRPADEHAFAERDLLLDLTTKGPRWLGRPEVAQCVLTNLLDGAAVMSCMRS
jgi:hypothetical protein